MQPSNLILSKPDVDRWRSIWSELQVCLKMRLAGEKSADVPPQVSFHQPISVAISAIKVHNISSFGLVFLGLPVHGIRLPGVNYRSLIFIEN
ncbi:MAG: hypothetical protein WB853_15655, partial [Desulfobacterales bacterium]